jgi:hypothetical protein
MLGMNPFRRNLFPPMASLNPTKNVHLLREEFEAREKIDNPFYGKIPRSKRANSLPVQVSSNMCMGTPPLCAASLPPIKAAPPREGSSTLRLYATTSDP